LRALKRVDCDDAKIISCVHDEAAVNYAAIRNLRAVGLLHYCREILCYSHALSNTGMCFISISLTNFSFTGKKIATPLVTKLLQQWGSLFNFSPMARLKYACFFKHACPWYAPVLFFD
jgi:hypothetical protein